MKKVFVTSNLYDHVLNSKSLAHAYGLVYESRSRQLIRRRVHQTTHVADAVGDGGRDGHIDSAEHLQHILLL